MSSLLPRWSSIEVRCGGGGRGPRARDAAGPSSITAAWWKEQRGRRVFVDFNQNAPHKTVFGAWSVRARPGAQVSCPFAWDELEEVRPDDLTMDSVARPPGAPRGSLGRPSLPRRSTRSSSWSDAIRNPGSPMPRGHPCTRKCPESHRGWLRAGHARRGRPPINRPLPALAGRSAWAADHPSRRSSRQAGQVPLRSGTSSAGRTAWRLSLAAWTFRRMDRLRYQGRRAKRTGGRWP